MSKTVIANLDDCPNRVPRQNDTPSSDGWCGSSAAPLANWIPQGFAFIVSFSSACDAHDRCWGTCSTAFGARSLCDINLGIDAGVACSTQIPWWAPSELLDLCLVQAALYAVAVSSSLGDNAWNEGQKKGCQCCP